MTDHRNGVLRLGPAPYLSDAQLTEALEIFREVAAAMKRPEAAGRMMPV